jgi:hypothetical protein
MEAPVVKTRALAWLPVGFAVAFLLAGLAAGDAAPAVLRTENEAGKILAVLGCFSAAFAFERGDYLRRAWELTGACLLLLLVRDATIIPFIDAAVGGARFDTARTFLVVLANASSVVGTALLARAWSVSGLSTAGRRASLLVAGVAVALAATGWPLVHDLRRLLGGDLDAVPWVASDLGDTIAFVLVVPVMQTALALRGGTLLWPWALLTAGGLCWILYDAAWGIGALLQVDAVIHVRLVTETLRGLACTFIACAGIAQRRVVVGAAATEVAQA